MRMYHVILPLNIHQIQLIVDLLKQVSCRDVKNIKIYLRFGIDMIIGIECVIRCM